MSENPKPLMKLSAICEGAAVSVISPASFAMPERVQLGVERLRQLGFSPKLGGNTQSRGPLFFGGSVEDRLADLHAAFANPETSLIAVLSTR
jgi:muramoyltetrapeptide carboxypeptidase